MTEKLSARTLQHYAQNAEQFKLGTWDHDVTQNRQALLGALGTEGPFDILDLGCGPGRDLVAFREMGHHVVGLDGCEQFVTMAKENSGAEVWWQDMLQLNLPPSRFDGVFANASLFHVPSDTIDATLAQLFYTLKPNGVLFTSNPRGDNQEGWSGDRYGVYYTWEAWRARLERAGFCYIDHFYRPEGLPRDQQPWLASVWRHP